MEIDNKLSRLFSKKNRQSKSLDKKLAISCQQFFTQSIEFRPASQPDSHIENLKSRYTPLNKITPTPSDVSMETDSTTSNSKTTPDSDVVPTPCKSLYNGDDLNMRWKRVRSIGAGLSNMGNTCFLNSVLQCLAYTPPLVNYLLSGEHKQKCGLSGFCTMCEFQKHCGQVLTANCVKPVSIVHHLRAIARHFRLGRQEDAHEFLRYFIDGLQRSCLHGYPTKLDPHSKATTVIHQIFGGYHRSQVKCLECQRTSNTYDPLLDMSLDIKNCTALSKALHRSIKPDLLEGDNSYACPYCKKMTKAQKRFTIQRLPRVLTMQLKRFDFNSMFGGKINKTVAYPEHIDMRPFMSSTQGPSEWYRLYAVLVHYGFSCHSGHYYCYVRNSNNCWYCMNDSQVSQASLSTVLQQEAYLLFYIRDENHAPPSGGSSKSQAVRSDPKFLSTPKKTAIGLDKTGTPFVQKKPTGVVPPSPKIITPPKMSSNGKITHNFSILLQKASISTATSKTTPTSLESNKPVFVPRQIKEPYKVKRSLKDKVKKKLVVPPSLSSLLEMDEDSKDDIQLAGSIQASNVASPKERPTRFIGPLLPSPTQISNEESTSAVALVSPKSHSGSMLGSGSEPTQSHSGSMLGSGSEPTQSHSESMLGSGSEPTQSHSGSILGSGSKPVALVRPSPHIDDSKTEKKIDPPPTIESTPSRLTLKHTPTPPLKHTLTPPHISTNHTLPNSSPQVDSTTSGDVLTSPKLIPYGPDLSSDHVTSTLGQNTPSPKSNSKFKFTSSLKRSKKNKKKRYRKRSQSVEESNHENSSDEVTSSKRRESENGGHKKRDKIRNKEHKKHSVSKSPSREGVESSRKHDRRQSRSRSRTPRRRISHPHTAPAVHRRRYHSYRDIEKVKRSRSRSLHREKLYSSGSSGEIVKGHDSGSERVKAHDSGGERVKEQHGDEERRLKKKRKKYHSDDKSPERKRHKSESSGENGKQGPEIVWDSGKKGQLAQWDGLRQSDVLEQLTSQDRLGVKSWDGGASVLGCGPPTEGRRGDRDTWDEELDRGKVKKVKTRVSGDDFSSTNKFQDMHDRRGGGGSHYYKDKDHKHHKPHKPTHKPHKWHHRH